MTRSRPDGVASPEVSRTRSTRHSAATSTAGPSILCESQPPTTGRTRRATGSSSPQKLVQANEPLPIPIPKMDLQPTLIASARRDKGKGRAVEPAAQPPPTSKRVLPARIRRAAGGGQDGIRDLEDMIVDWLDRFGYPSDSPPGKMRVTITSLPIDMVDPPVYTTGPTEVLESITITPQTQAGPSSSRTGAEVIETPDWVMVKAGQDDQEEAREELSSRITLSPVRRLRRLSGNEEHGEDTSDEHYIRLHKRYEAIEKRQRKDERDKLAFERYKMRTRIDLLRGMSTPAWSSVVWTVLAREDTTGHWVKGKAKVKVEGIEWLRRRLVKEGEEVMKRYDQLLPVDPRKSRLLDDRVPTPTPFTISRSPSPAQILPARVTALKDPSTLQRRRSLPTRPARVNSPRKRRRSDAATSTAPTLNPTRRIIRITRQSQAQSSTDSRTASQINSPAAPTNQNDDAVSDTESEPLSDPPSESDEESTLGGRGDAGSMTSEPPGASPSLASVSSTSSVSISSEVVPPRQGTRASARTRIVVDRKPPARTSARIRQSLGEDVPPRPPVQVESVAPTKVLERVSVNREAETARPGPLPMSIDDNVWSSNINREAGVDSKIETAPNGMIVDQVTLDEQLEMDTVEAAVII